VASLLLVISSVYLFFLQRGGGPVLLVKAEGRYFVKSTLRGSQLPPQRVSEIVAYLQNRSSEISSYRAEVSVTSTYESGKMLLYVDKQNSRSRTESISYFQWVETRTITTFSDSTSFYYVPETGVAIRTHDTTQEDEWSFGPESEYIGVEEVAVEECFKIRDSVIGYEVEYWFSKQTGLLMKVYTRFPQTKYNQTMTYTYSDINVPIDPELFSLPSEVEMKDTPFAETPNTVVLTMPIVTEDQAPLFLTVETNPPEYLLDYEVMPQTGMNQVAKIILRPMLEGWVEIRLSAYALVKPKDYSSILKNSKISPDLALEIEEWTKPQPSIQCSAAEISMVAESLEDQDETIWRTASNVLDFMKNVKSRGGVQDAVNVLKTKGAVCNGFATLSCALLRANGIPARVLAVMPVGMKIAMHYLVEFFVPGYGWVWFEPSFKKLPHQTTEDIVIGVMYPDDDLGTGGYHGIYTSRDVTLTMYDPVTGQMGGLEAEEVSRYSVGRKKAVEAYGKTIQLWHEYMTEINPKSQAEKAELIEYFEEGIAVLAGQNINSYNNFIESLRSKFEQS
jgi:transglutaminase-like putative cysteine protease